MTSHRRAMLVLLLCAGCGGQGSEVGRAPVSVRVAPVESAPAVSFARYPGVARADREVRLGFPQGGRIERIAVAENQPVGAGDTLAVLERHGLAAAVEAARAARDQALRSYRRLSDLKESGAAPEARLEEARSSWEVAEANLSRAARALEDAVLRSPMSGTVVGELLEEGTVVGAGAPVLSVMGDGAMRVLVWVGDQTRRRVLEGERARIYLGSGPESLMGRVVLASAVAETRPAAYRIEVEVADSAEALIPGMAVEVELPLHAGEGQLLVPTDALVARGLGTSVFAVRGAKAREVSVAARELRIEGAVVTGAIRPGDSVVVRGAEYLRDGAPVEVTE